MARTNATNFTGGLQFPYATAATDLFKKEDVQTLALAVDQHDHTAGKGLSVAPTAGSVTNAMLGPDVARANLLTNGGFEIWQRGNGPFTANGVYSSDRWRQDLSGSSTLSVSKASSGSSGTPTAPNGALQGTYVHNAESFVTQYLVQADKVDLLAGRSITFAMDVNANAANAVRLRLATNGTGSLNVLSAFAAGDGAWHRLSVTGLVPNDATTVTVGISLMASATFYLNDAMLVVGSQAANYVPLHPADDLARCLRYYEILGETPNEFLVVGYTGAGMNDCRVYGYKARKAVAPTATKNGTWNITNCGQPTVQTAGVSSVAVQTNVTALGAWNYNNNAVGANITLEANP